MGKLLKRFDGFTEDGSGNFAVFPLRFSGRTAEGNKFFNFRPSHDSDILQIEWPEDDTIVTIPSEIAGAMVKLGYVRNLTTDEVEQFNDSMGFNEQEDEKKKKGRPAKQADNQPPALILPGVNDKAGSASKPTEGSAQ